MKTGMATQTQKRSTGVSLQITTDFRNNVDAFSAPRWPFSCNASSKIANVFAIQMPPLQNAARGAPLLLPPLPMIIR